MKRSLYLLGTLLLLVLSLTGCDLVGDVIEFTLWTVLIIVIVVVLIVIAIVKAIFD